MEMKDRIIKFLTHENLTATRFADEIGVQRSSVSHILSGRNNPSFDFIQKILSRYKTLSADWLLVGSGTMFKKSEGQLTEASKPSMVPPVKTNQLNLFGNTENLSSGESSKTNQAVKQAEKTALRKIEKILVFYNDKTFDEYTQG